MTRQEAIEEAKPRNATVGVALLKHGGVDIYAKVQPTGGMISLASAGMPLTDELCADWAKGFDVPESAQWDRKTGLNGRYASIAWLAWGVTTA